MVKLLMIMMGVSLGVQVAGAGEVKFLKTDFERGEPVKVRVSGPGHLTIESDLAPAPREVEIGKDGIVDLGTVRKPGVYFVRISEEDKTKAYAACLFFTPNEKPPSDAAGDSGPQAPGASGAAAKLRLTVAEVSRVARPTSEDNKAILGKFNRGLTRERVAQAAQAEIGEKSENATAVICAIPGQQVACAVGSKQAVDLTVSVVSRSIDFMVADKHLTAAEGVDIRRVLSLGNAVILLGEPTARWNALFAMTGPGVTTSVGKGAAQFAAKKVPGSSEEKYAFVISVKGR